MYYADSSQDNDKRLLADFCSDESRAETLRDVLSTGVRQCSVIYYALRI